MFTPGTEITEKQKKDFMARNNFYCKNLKMSISKKTCENYQIQSIAYIGYHPMQKCIECEKFDVDLLKDRQKKVCKLHSEYPGFCFGTGKFERATNQNIGAWTNKIFCTNQCGHRYNYFKRSGWNSPEQLPSKYSDQIKKT